MKFSLFTCRSSKGNMKNNLLFLLPLFCLFSCSKCIEKETHISISKECSIQKPTTSLMSIYLIDRNGLAETITAKERLSSFEHTDFLSSQPYQKVLRVFSKNRNGSSLSLITSYYQNGEIKQYLEAENGRALGAYIEWHPNGKKKLIGRLVAGKPDIDDLAQLSWSFDGKALAFDEEGQLLADITYSKGVIEGPALYYHQNGELKKKCTFAKGALEGELFAFDEKSDLVEHSFFEKGLQNGPSEGFWAKNKPKWTEHYTNGLLEKGSYFDKEGNQLFSIEKGCGKRYETLSSHETKVSEYKDGIEEGLVWLYDEKGNLRSSYSIKDDEKHGQEVRYYPPKPFSDGKSENIPKMSLDWFEGKIHGTVKTYYKDGSIESQKEMCQNERHGLLLAWYPNRNLMLSEEYVKGKLLKGQYFKKDSQTPVSNVENGEGSATLFDEQGCFYRKISYKNGKPVDDVAS